MPDKDTQLYKIITFAVGAFCLYFAWSFWWGSGLFAGAVAPVPDADGMVSVAAVGKADTALDLINVVMALVSGLGATVLAVVFGVVRYITGLISPMINPTPPTSAPDLRNLSMVSFDERGAGGMPQQQIEEMSRLLVKACVDGNSRLVIALAEELHGSQFLTTKTTATRRKTSK